jgi:phosphoglucosamine mutase
MLTRSMRADLGVMISASHNPFADNGIKLFGPDGYKLSDEDELAIEALLEREPKLVAPPSDRPRQADRRRARPLHPLRQVDLPRAAAARRAQDRGRLRQRRRLPVAPDALVGAGRRGDPARRQPQRHQHQRRVRLDPPRSCCRKRWSRAGADIGLALDGDADRLIVVDEKGKVIDGDQLMALIALDQAAAGAAARRRRGRDGDVQPRPRAEARRRGPEAAAHQGRRPLRARGDAGARAATSAASSPGTSS